MAQICYRCGKGNMTGRLVSHSKIHTKRVFKANLQTFWVTEKKGKQVKAKFCASCMRQTKRENAARKLVAPAV